jgi:microcystin-dependent protein
LHNHAFSVNNALATTPSPSGNYLAQGGAAGAANASMYATGSSNAVMAAGTIANAGSTQPISIIQPYGVINYSIALNGIFPSRN